MGAVPSNLGSPHVFTLGFGIAQSGLPSLTDQCSLELSHGIAGTPWTLSRHRGPRCQEPRQSHYGSGLGLHLQRPRQGETFLACPLPPVAASRRNPVLSVTCIPVGSCFRVKEPILHTPKGRRK